MRASEHPAPERHSWLHDPKLPQLRNQVPGNRATCHTIPRPEPKKP